VNAVEAPRIVDTNAILRYILADHDAHYRLACDFMKGVRNGTSTAFIPESVAVECVYVLLKVYKVPRVEISTQLGALLAYRGVTMDDKKVMLTALQVFAEHNIGMIDALVLALSKAKNWPLISFDKALNKLKEHL